MQEHSESTISEHVGEHLSFGRYVLGFVLSIAITVAAYLVATTDNLSRGILIASLSSLAIVQFVVQMVLFLHVAEERKPRWKLAVMGLMLMVVLILVVGSIWIMDNLNYRMMDNPQLMQKYIQSQDKL